MKLITTITDKDKKETTRLFKPADVFELIQRLELGMPAYEMNVYALIEQWNRLKQTLLFYSQAPIEDIEAQEKKEQK